MTTEIEGFADNQRSDFRSRLGGFGPVGIAAFLVIAAISLSLAPIGGLLIILWARLAHIPLKDLGFVRPRSWFGGFVFGVALGVTLKFAMKALVMPLFGAPPVNEVFHHLATDRTQAAIFAAYAIFGAGFGEELIFRGYLFERSARLFGRSALATVATLLVTSAIFAVLHFKQGLPGIEKAAVVGFVLAATFVANGRRLWPVMVAHAAFDLTALAMILLNMELPVSKLVFR